MTRPWRYYGGFEYCDMASAARTRTPAFGEFRSSGLDPFDARHLSHQGGLRLSTALLVVRPPSERMIQSYTKDSAGPRQDHDAIPRKPEAITTTTKGLGRLESNTVVLSRAMMPWLAIAFWRRLFTGRITQRCLISRRDHGIHKAGLVHNWCMRLRKNARRRWRKAAFVSDISKRDLC